MLSSQFQRLSHHFYQSAGRQFNYCIGLPFFIGKFHKQYTVGKNLDDCAQSALLQFPVRLGFEQNDRIEKRNF